MTVHPSLLAMMREMYGARSTSRRSASDDTAGSIIVQLESARINTKY
jgi:hypothetical protein